jgi:hypothetical protein
VKPAPLTDNVITAHAISEMKRRGLSEETIHAVLAAPEQWLEVRPGRVLLQSRVSMEVPKKTYLVRVFVDGDRDPAEVVTVYRTTKIPKYWREES